MLILRLTVGVSALALGMCFGQDAPAINATGMSVARFTHTVDNKRCALIDHLAACESPGPIYAWNLDLALKGNVEAAYQVGLAYLQGYGVIQDTARADYWFLIGAQSSYDKQWIADQYRAGRYLPKSLEKTDFWYRGAADHFSLHELAKIYRSGEMAPPDAAKAIALDLELLKGNDGYSRLARFELGNMVIDGQYSSGDRRQDLRWAREIAQELIGQEEYKLAWAAGSAMDLPGSPEVERAVVCSAASFNVDLAQIGMAREFPTMSEAEHYAWIRLAGRNQQAARSEADAMLAAMRDEERAASESAVMALDETLQHDGAYYRNDDALRAPDFAKLEANIAKYGDPEEQLRLAFHYEADVGGTERFNKAMAIYHRVRDQRVDSVRLRIGNEYLLGINGFPRSPERAQQWYQFAAKAGSAKACERLAEMQAGGC